jgi:hypothetical protein
MENMQNLFKTACLILVMIVSTSAQDALLNINNSTNILFAQGEFKESLFAENIKLISYL